MLYWTRPHTGLFCNNAVSNLGMSQFGDATYQLRSVETLVLQHARVDRLENGIQSFQLDTCRGGRELPVNAALGGVTIAFPDGDFGGERCTVGQPAVEALAAAGRAVPSPPW